MDHLLAGLVDLVSLGITAVYMLVMATTSCLSMAVPIVGFGGLVYVLSQHQSRRRKAFRQGMAELGFTPVGRGFDGVIDDEPIALRPRSTGSGKHRRYYMDFQVRLPASGLSVTHKNVFSPSRQRSGDPAFDDQFMFQATVEGRGWLTHTLRRQLLALRGSVQLSPTLSSQQRAFRRTVHDVHVRDDVLTVVHRGQSPSREEVLFLCRELAAVASSFRDAPWDPEFIVRSDPEPGVRYRMLAAYAQQHLPEAEALAREVLASDETDPEVRLQATIVLGDGDGLVTAALDPGLSEALRLRAADAASGPWRIRAIGGLVASDNVSLGARALVLCEGFGSPELSGALLGAGPIVASAGYRASLHPACEVLATLLGRHPVDGAGPLLERMLQIEDADVRRSAVQALALAGTSVQVPALRELEGQLGLFDGALRMAIGQAVARIQSRVEGGAGGLAIVDAADAAGQLSLAQAARPKVRS